LNREVGSNSPVVLEVHAENRLPYLLGSKRAGNVRGDTNRARCPYTVWWSSLITAVIQKFLPRIIDKDSAGTGRPYHIKLYSLHIHAELKRVFPFGPEGVVITLE